MTRSKVAMEQPSNIGGSSNKSATGRASAGTNLAGVAELVEMILINLPMRDILLAQRVDRTWKALIENSPKLQKLLFFRPITSAMLTTVGGPDNIRECTGIVDCDPHLPEIESERSKSYWAYNDSTRKFGGTVFINPLILAEFVPASKPPPYGHNRKLNFIAFRTKRDVRESMSNAGASWRRMLLTQPPVIRLAMDEGIAAHWHSLNASKGEIGITMQDFEVHLKAFGEKIAQIGFKEFYYLNADMDGAGLEMLEAQSDGSE